MATSIHHSLILFMIALFATVSCTHTIVYVDQEPGTGVYLSGYPVANASPYLEKMHQSLKRITSTSYYDTFLFDPESRITSEDIRGADSPAQWATMVLQTHKTSAGSAIVIHNRDFLVGMITTNHVITSPDTLYDYQETGSEYLHSVTVKTSQVNWLFDTPYVGPFEVLATDEAADLAIIGARIDPDMLDVSVRTQFPVFPYKFGNPEKLRIGTFIYSLGYPRGYPMVTTGIVSKTHRDRHHSFVTDGLFNPGFSGGVVVAINGGVPAFEWVGMARSASASREWFLVPDEQTAEGHLQHLPFESDAFIKQKAMINYGITHVTSSTQIKKILEDNAIYLLSRGYNIIPLIQQ